MNDFVVRLISSVLFSVIFLFFIFFNYYALMCALLLISLYEIFKLNNKLIVIVIFVLLLTFLFSFYQIRTSPNGIFITIWCILITWITDTGAYIIGKLLGKNKIKKISPNKTYEGFVGGILLAQISYYLLDLFVKNKYYFTFEKIFFIQFFISCSVIFGDLLFSFFKRKLLIKDYSNLIPGHGGLLDRLDGLILSTILFNLIVNL